MTTELSAAQKGRLAHQLVPVAMELAGLVREDGDAEAIAGLLGSLAAAELAALPVVLAAMVDTSQTPQELLSWVTWDEHMHALPPDAEMVLWDGKRRTPGTTERPQAECGSPWGYDRHRKHWEPVCEPCRVAYNDYQKAKRRNRQQRQSEAVA